MQNPYELDFFISKKKRKISDKTVDISINLLENQVKQKLSISISNINNTNSKNYKKRNENSNFISNNNINNNNKRLKILYKK